MLEGKVFTESKQHLQLTCTVPENMQLGNNMQLFIFNKMAEHMARAAASGRGGGRHCYSPGTGPRLCRCLRWGAQPAAGYTHPTAGLSSHSAQASAWADLCARRPRLLPEMQTTLLCFFKIRIVWHFSVKNLSFGQKSGPSDIKALPKQSLLCQAVCLGQWGDGHSDKVQAVVSAFFMEQHILVAFIQNNFCSSNSPCSHLKHYVALNCCKPFLFLL